MRLFAFIAVAIAIVGIGLVHRARKTTGLSSVDLVVDSRSNGAPEDVSTGTRRRVSTVLIDVNRPPYRDYGLARTTAMAAIMVARLVEAHLHLAAGQLTVATRRCNNAVAVYDAKKRRITLCEEMTEFFIARSRQLGAPISLEVARDMLVFVGMHEVGHAVTQIYHIPVLGGTENAADGFAVWFLLKHNFPETVRRGTITFVLLMQNSTDEPTSDLLATIRRYGEVHPLPEQRLANLACWSYGAGIEEEANEVPSERRENCHDEYDQLRSAWETSLQPHLLLERASPNAQ